DYNLALLKPLGIEQLPQLNLNMPATAHDKAKQLLQHHKIDSPFIIFHPGSARMEKFWEPARWKEVIERACRHWQVNAVITGGTWNFEKQHIDEIKERLSGEEVGAGREASTALVAD